MDVVFDIEADNLYSTVTKLHCIALKRIGIDKDVLLFDRENIKEGICILKSADRLIGHNIIQYDIPVIEKLYDIKLTTNVLDTINLSMICFPEYKQHGLEHWGQRLGFEKFNPVTGDIDDCYLYVEPGISVIERKVKGRDQHDTANARLIAAAPDLLEALESVSQEHDLLRWMKNIEMRRSRGSFGIAVADDSDAIGWQEQAEKLKVLVDRRESAIARARGEA